jgi:SprT protein
MDAGNSAIIDQVETTIRETEEQARQHYNISLPDAGIDYSLRGRCAAQARVDRNGQTFLRINLQLLSENLDDYLKQTVPHEIAHLVVNWQHRHKRQRPRPHGKEWQGVMRHCYSLEPIRCHNYRTTPARVVPRNALYRCNCREHHLTRIMHNKISRSSRALCKACHAPLKFIATQPD